MQDGRKHPLARCEECPLQETGKYVPSLLRSTPKLVVIGEAPGFYESTYGEPFKGPSGKLLNQVLEHYGYARRDVTFTNVVACRPEDNATPPKAAIAACRPRLHHELSVSGCRDILTLGGTASQAISSDNRTISTVRVGPPKEPNRALRDLGFERVVSTWHPAYCLRTADAFPTMVSDIGKLKENTRGVWSPPEWESTDDPDIALELIERIRRSTDKIVIDIEAGIEKDTSFDHPNEFDLLCVGIAYARGRAVVFGSGAFADTRVRDALKELFHVCKIIAHNGKFDLAGLYPTFGALRLWFDTMLANYCLDERPGQHGLKVLAVEKLGAPKYDDEIFQYIPRGGNYGNIPRPILYKYNAYDVACTWDLFEILEPRLEEEDVRKVHDFLVAAANELMYLELNGITLDREYGKKLVLEFKERLAHLEDELDRIVSEDQRTTITPKRGEPFEHWARTINPRSPKQIKEYLAEHRISVESTNVDTLEGLVDMVAEGSHVFEFLKTLLIHRRQQKLYSTYVEGIRKRAYRGRVFTTYTLHGTTSGRLASRNPNLQNIVRDKSIRKQFTAGKPDNVLIQCLAPGTKVLMRDLTWKNVEDVLPGENMIGFDERDIGNMLPSVAEQTSRVVKKTYKLTFANGAQVVCSEDHKWPVGVYGRTKREWRTTKQIAEARSKNFKFSLLVEPWKTDTSYEAGYVAGFLDGEATLTGMTERGGRITWGQNQGAVADRVAKTFTDKGFDVREYGEGKHRTFYLAGDNRVALRALGMFRPERFLEKSEQLILGRRKHKPVDLISIEYVGLQEVVALQTSTRTFIAEGFLSHNCDYKQAEGRVIATLAQDEYLRSIFSNPDIDMFNELSDQLYGVGRWTKEERVRTKAFFYGLGYGREAASIAKEYDIPFKEAQRRMNDFMSLIPATVRWQEDVRRRTLAGDDLVTPFGRRRRFHLITEQNKKDVLNEALSFLPQSTASDICLGSLIVLRPMLRGIGFIRLTIHDALVAECHESKADQVIGMMQEVMEGKGREFTDYVPFAVDATIGRSWGEL